MYIVQRLKVEDSPVYDVVSILKKKSRRQKYATALPGGFPSVLLRVHIQPVDNITDQGEIYVKLGITKKM